MSVLVIQLTQEEKQILLSFLKEKEVSISGGERRTKQELKILEECVSRPPVGAPAKWLEQLVTKCKQYKVSINRMEKNTKDYKTVVEGIDKGKEVPIKATIISMLGELYSREREKKRVDEKYIFYPRLKKAKEASLHVFSNKIKLIMEAENVKVA